MASTVSEERFQQFLKISIKYYSWDIILGNAGITDVSDKGDQYEISCILHDDKRPSLRLNKHLGIYHCFSCGAAGSYTKFLWELSGRSVPYTVYCDQILKANPLMQSELGFNSIFVDEKTLDNAFNRRRVFDRKSHLGSGLPITVLEKKVRALGDNWENLVLSLVLLQQDVDPSSVLSVIEKRKVDVVVPKERISVMDLLGSAV